jgi:hypothetical protein
LVAKSCEKINIDMMMPETLSIQTNRWKVFWSLWHATWTMALDPAIDNKLEEVMVNTTAAYCPSERDSS